MKKLILISVLGLSACTTTSWQTQLAPDSLASNAIVATADHYGGAKAANLASAGLYATADVLQGYIDKKPPIDIITQSAGVEGVGHTVLDYLKDKKYVTQKTVDNIHKAALFAAKMTYSKGNQ